MKLKDDFGLKVARVRINHEPTYRWVGVRTKDWVKEEQKILEQLEDFSDETREQLK